MSKAPIGVLDSGVGGISVLQQIQRQLPNENLLYFADSAYAPYGDTQPQQVESRVHKIAEFLQQQGVKSIVIACNTATAVAIDTLRQQYDFPIIGLEPAVKPAVIQKPGGVIGVLATANTLASQKYQRLKAQFTEQAEIIDCACHGLVEYIEAGQQDTAEFYQLLSRYLQVLQDQHVDTVVLGCTHYPFIKPQLRKIIGHAVTVVDSAEAVAKQLQRQLLQHHLAADDAIHRQLRFCGSGVDAAIVARLYGQPVQIESITIR